MGTVCVVFVIEVMFGFVNGVGTVASVFSGVVIPCVVFCLSIVSIFSSVLIDLLLLVVFAIESFGTSSIFVGIVLGVAFIYGVVFSFLIFRDTSSRLVSCIFFACSCFFSCSSSSFCISLSFSF